jgi:ElaB/YqjD/DUF883 family membrane-anchored ribosome-binding protein
MDNQKTNEGSARDTGREGSGTSMGKDPLSGRSEGKAGSSSSGAGSSGSSDRSSGSTGSATGASTGAVGGTSNAGSASSSGTGSMGSGTTGSSGTSGVSGTSGTSGVSGTSGISSSTGTSGSSMGTSGANGTSSSDITKGISAALRPDELHKTIDKAVQAAQPVVERLATSAHAGVDKMSGLLSGATQTMGQRQQQLTDASRQLMDTSREYIRQKPGTAMALAIGAGFILAKLLGGSRRDY